MYRKRGEAHPAGTVHLYGFDEKYWVCGNCAESKAQHEAEITEILLHLFVDEVHSRELRRADECDQRFWADAEFDVNGEHFALERDRGTVGFSELLERAAGYAEFVGDVFWVFSDEKRLNGFLKRVKDLGPHHWATLYTTIIEDPHGQIFQNADDLWNAIPHSTS